MNLKKIKDTVDLGMDFRKAPSNVLSTFVSMASDPKRGFNASKLSNVSADDNGITFTIPGQEFTNNDLNLLKAQNKVNIELTFSMRDKSPITTVRIETK